MKIGLRVLRLVTPLLGYNNTLDSFRHLIGVSIKAGARHGNPAANLGRREVRQKQLKLPERQSFQQFVAEIASAGAWCSQNCADFVRLLAFTGCRKNEAASILWHDVDFNLGRIHLRITKNGQPRYVPMISDARELLERLRAKQADYLAKAVFCSCLKRKRRWTTPRRRWNEPNHTPHSRHLFATQCIEAGIDIPIVSRWFGHVDGGALAMKVYGHLRDTHSSEQARRLSFNR